MRLWYTKSAAHPLLPLPLQGLSMTPEQWSTLVAGMGTLDAGLGAQ